MTEYATILAKCPSCGNSVKVENGWTPGGVYDKGGFVLACEECKAPFELHVGRDINMSRVQTGASVLETYDDEIDGSRESALARHGLKSN